MRFVTFVNCRSPNLIHKPNLVFRSDAVVVYDNPSERIDGVVVE